MQRKKIFYGWFIVAAGMCITAMGIGIVMNCFSLLVVPVCEELGFTREQMGYNQLIHNGGTMLVALVGAPLFRRVKMKPLMCVSGVMLCVVYFLYSYATTLPAFYIISVFAALGQGLITVMPMSIIIHNWFHEKAGLALGLTFTGSGIGGMIFNKLGGTIIAAHGWRSMVQIYTVVLAAVLIPCLFFVMKTRPEDKGLLPLGVKKSGQTEEVHGLTLKQAARTGRFYLLILGLFISGMAVNAIASTATPHITDVWLSKEKAATYASGFMLCLAFGKTGLGWLYDKLGARWATTISLGLLCTAHLALSQARFEISLIVYVLASGLACAFGSVPLGVLSAKAFGNRDYAAITGVFTTVSSFGAMLASPICGRVCDMTGSYVPAYYVAAAVTAAIILPMVLSVPARKKRRSDAA